MINHPKLTGNEIAGILRKEIKTLTPGSKIPPEIELAKKFNVSRATMNKIIVKLVDENILTRKKFDGTFVAEPVIPKRVINYLIPCPDFFATNLQTILEFRNQAHNRLCGMTRYAYEVGAKVEHIIVTPDNDRNNINWQNLEHINQDSLVHVDGIWYETLFPYLHKSGAKVTFINSQLSELENYSEFLGKCYQLKIHRREAVKELYGAMVRRHCRRIGIFARNIRESDHPLRAGFTDGALAFGGDPDAVYSLPMMPDPSLTFDARTKMLQDFQKKFELDGIIFSGYHLMFPHLTGLHRIFGIPDNVQFGIYDGCSNDLTSGADCLVSGFNLQTVGYNAAKALLNPSFVPGSEDFYAEIF